MTYLNRGIVSLVVLILVFYCENTPFGEWPQIEFKNLKNIFKVGLDDSGYPNIVSAVNRLPPTELTYDFKMPVSQNDEFYQRFIEIAFPRRYVAGARCKVIGTKIQEPYDFQCDQ